MKIKKEDIRSARKKHTTVQFKEQALEQADRDAVPKAGLMLK